MILSSMGFSKNKSATRNIKLSFKKDGEDKKNSKIKDLKHSGSLKLMNTYNNYYNSKLDLNLMDSDKTNYVKIVIPKKENKINICIQKGFSSLFDSKKILNSITSKIEQLITKHKYNKLKLYYILIKIQNFVNNLFKRNDFEIINNQISYFNNETKGKLTISNNENLDGKSQYLELKILKKKINKLIQKNEEMENKFKIERLSYLFCIGENQKKIKELTNQLNIESIDKMPMNELNKVLCFPDYSKFSALHKKNIKTNPRNLSTKAKEKVNKILKRNNSQKSDSDNYDFNQMFKTELKEYKHNISFSLNNSKNKEYINKNDTLDDEKDEEYRKIIGKTSKINDVNDTIELGKKYFEQHVPSIDIFKNKKNYFVSHPKLNYIKNKNSDNNIIKVKVGGKIKSLPKQFANFKKIINSNKNAIIVFPSVVNETISNFEKLKNNKTLRKHESKYEDAHKTRLKSLI